MLKEGEEIVLINKKNKKAIAGVFIKIERKGRGHAYIIFQPDGISEYTSISVPKRKYIIEKFPTRFHPKLKYTPCKDRQKQRQMPSKLI